MKPIAQYIVTVFFLVSFNYIQAQEDKVIQFGGVFPHENEKSVLITLKQVKSKLSAALKYDSDAQTHNFEGYINKENNFKLYQLDNDSNRTGVSIKGSIANGKMQGNYSDKETVYDFELQEVDVNSQSGEIKVVKRINEAFADLELYFKTAPNANMNIKYDDFAPAIKVSDSPFLDKAITKVGSYDAPFTIQERMRYIEKHSYGSKIKFEEGCTGLIVHAYYFSQDGPLFNTYIFIYNEFGDFVQAFVLYESMKKDGDANISTKFSMSQIFVITDYSQGIDNPIKFKIDKDGNFDLMDR